MKKYIIVIFPLIFLYLAVIVKTSYAYVSCESNIVYPKETTTKNIYDYLNDKYKDTEINYLCSYEYCYHKTNTNTKDFINEFIIFLNNKTPEEIQEITFVKGYSITEISFNTCV